MLRRWSWVLVLVVGVALYESVRAAVFATKNPNLLPALILLGAAVVPAAFTAFVAGRRLVFDIGGGLVALTALVGGGIGVGAARFLGDPAPRPPGLLPPPPGRVLEGGAEVHRPPA